MSVVECSFVATDSLGPRVSGDALVLGFDFYALLAAVRLLFAGRDPYELCAYLGELNSLGRLPSSSFPFPYPPNIFFLTAPFALLPPAMAVYIWTFMQIGVLWGVLFWVRRRVRLKSSLVLQFSLALLFPGVVRHLYYGQVTLFILGLFLASFSLWEGRKFFLSGLILSLALSKPHVALLPLLVLALRSISKQNFTWITGVLVGLSLQAGVLLLTFPTVIFSFFGGLQEIVVEHQALMESILRFGWFPGSISFLNLYIFPAAAIISIFALTVPRPALSTRDVLLLALGLSLLVSPYLWLHDAVLLLPLYLALVVRLSAQSHKLALSFLCILAVFWVWHGGFLLVYPYEWILKIVSAGFVFTYWRVVSSECSAASRSSTSI